MILTHNCKRAGIDFYAFCCGKQQNKEAKQMNKLKLIECDKKYIKREK